MWHTSPLLKVVVQAVTDSINVTNKITFFIYFSGNDCGGPDGLAPNDGAVTGVDVSELLNDEDAGAVPNDGVPKLFEFVAIAEPPNAVVLFILFDANVLLLPKLAGA
jgi:hypothetical protein